MDKQKSLIYTSILLILLITISFLTSCSKNPTGPEPDEIIYSPQAVQLEESTINSIVAMDTTGIITFSKITDELKSLQQGNIIVCNSTTVIPYGFLKQVENVTILDNAVKVSTSDATLEDVFQKASFTFRKELTMDDLKGNPILKKGVSLKRSEGNGFQLDIDEVLYDIDGNYNTRNDQIKATGSIEINPSFQFNLRIDNFALQELKFLNTTIQTSTFNISWGCELVYDPDDVRIAEFPFNPITIWVVWVPIVIYPVLGVDVGAEVSASLGFNTSVTQSATLEVGLEYKNNSWNPIGKFNKNFEYNQPELNATLTAKGYAGPQLNLLLYGVAGPYADVHGYLELTADVFNVPLWELYGGAEVGVGVEVKFLGKQIADYHVPVEELGYRQLIAKDERVLKGTIAGIIKDAVNLAPLGNVAVKVKKEASILAETQSNSNGEYSLNVQAGMGYIVEFSKNAYLPVTYENVQVPANTEIHLEPILQIDVNHSGVGNISGRLVNALNGKTVSGLSLNIRKGVNNTAGTVLNTTNTDTYGYYYFYNIEAGNYTIEASLEGFNTTHFSVICIGGTTTSGQDATITPVLNPDEYRIILTWGEYPRDLDSHLTGPTPDGYRFHTFFYDKLYSYGGETYAELDLDDITSYGPETTTIYHKINGMYRYSVHDYTNRNSTYSFALANSNAQVRIYKGSELKRTFYVPTNTDGTLWTVFELMGDNIVPKNLMSYESYAGGIPQIMSQQTDANLMHNLPKK